PASELVDDDHASVVLEQVMRVPLIQMPRLQGLAHQVLAAQPTAPETAQWPGRGVKSAAPAFREIDAPLASIDREVLGPLEAGGERQRLLVHAALRARVDTPGDDQRRASLVDEHAVRLVDDGEVQATQHELAQARALARQALDLQSKPRGGRA